TNRQRGDVHAAKSRKHMLRWLRTGPPFQGDRALPLGRTSLPLLGAVAHPCATCTLSPWNGVHCCTPRSPLRLRRRRQGELPPVLSAPASYRRRHRPHHPSPRHYRITTSLEPLRFWEAI